MLNKILSLRYFFPIVVLLFLSGCSRRTMIFFADQYLYESGMIDSLQNRKTGEVLKEGGVDLDLRILKNDQAALEKIRRTCSQETPAAVVLSPLFREFGTKLAEEFPRIRFVSIMMHPPEKDTLDMATAYVDRTEAMRQAGELAGIRLKDLEKEQKRIFHASGVWYTGSQMYRRELEAFLEGFSSAEEEDRLLLHRIDSLADKQDVEDFLHGLTGKETGMGIAYASAFDPLCLDKFEELGIAFCTEEYNPKRGEKAALPVLTVNISYTRILRRIAENLSSGKWPLRIEAELDKPGWETGK